MKLKPKHLIAGQKAEHIAYKYLVNKGLKLIDKNYSCRYGEIDLIMGESGVLIFVEVRYRKSTEFGLAQETVRPGKQIKIVKTAQHFLLDKKMTDQCACRFDIVAIHGTIPNHKIDWISNAFYAES